MTNSTTTTTITIIAVTINSILLSNFFPSLNFSSFIRKFFEKFQYEKRKKYEKEEEEENDDLKRKISNLWQKIL